VPKDWVHKIARKIQATGEVYGKIMGTIDTPEKFEAKRLTLAENEWRRMKGSDSRECRNCHTFEGMNTEVQKQRARKQHELAQRDKETCIDCHKGIAHQKPKGMKEDDE
jgi:cytochrome c-type protein NapC